MENFYLIAFALSFGYVLQRFKIFPEETPLILNKFVIYISLPALILIAIPKLEFTLAMFIPPLIAWIVIGLLAIVVLIVSRLLHFSKKVEGSLMLVSVLTNSSFVGIPMITAYLGMESLPYLMMYDQLGTAMALSIYGTIIVAYYSGDKEVSNKQILTKILTFPPFIAFMIALIFIGKTYISEIEFTLHALASTVIPLALIAAGLQIKLILPKEELAPFGVSLIIKLVFAPFVAFVVAYIFQWDSLASDVAILESGMAPMITAGAVASMAGLAPRLSSAIVGYGILFSFGSSAILYMLL